MRYALLAAAVLAVTVPAVEAQSQGQPKFAVTGVVVSDGEKAMAWITEPTLTKGEPLIVRRGDTVGPYRVLKIQEDRVEFSAPTGEAIVVRYGGSAPTGAPAEPAAAAPAPPPERGAAAAAPATPPAARTRRAAPVVAPRSPDAPASTADADPGTGAPAKKRAAPTAASAAKSGATGAAAARPAETTQGDAVVIPFGDPRTKVDFGKLKSAK